MAYTPPGYGRGAGIYTTWVYGRGTPPGYIHSYTPLGIPDHATPDPAVPVSGAALLVGVAEGPGLNSEINMGEWAISRPKPLKVVNVGRSLCAEFPASSRE